VYPGVFGLVVDIVVLPKGIEMMVGLGPSRPGLLLAGAAPADLSAAYNVNCIDWLA
jgi:hypothetical protein